MESLCPCACEKDDVAGSAPEWSRGSAILIAGGTQHNSDRSQNAGNRGRILLARKDRRGCVAMSWDVVREACLCMALRV